jgi:arginine/lysine/ornithine decarboxylase
MDTTTIRKRVNKVKARVKEVQGPVRKSQDAAPIADAMADYHRRGMLSFAIPAHSGGRGPAPEFTKWAGMDAARSDLPMSHGVDTRDRAWKVQSTAQELFAEAVGAKQTFFSTNGSSMNARVAIMAVAGPGEKLVMARNGHKSTFSGLVMSGAMPVYVEPYYDEELTLALGPLPEDVRATLAAHPDAKAALISTPSYYGTSADVRALANACHEHGVPLVTDDAWGLDYDLVGHPGLPEGGLTSGADLAIGSVHKTLTGPGQTSVLSVGSDRIDVARLKLCFELEESTSISSFLLSGIDGARRQFVREGEQLLDRALRSADLLRERVADEVPELRVVSTGELTACPGVTGVDPGHVIIETAPIGLTGYTADDWLRDERQIDVELADHRRIMALVTFAHGEQEIDRFVNALRDLVDAHSDSGDSDWIPDMPVARELRAEQVMLPREAFFSPYETVKPKDAIGRVSADLVTPYPPGIPVLAPGEAITDTVVGYLEKFVAAGGFVEGATDQSLDRFRVVA